MADPPGPIPNHNPSSSRAQPQPKNPQTRNPSSSRHGPSHPPPLPKPFIPSSANPSAPGVGAAPSHPVRDSNPTPDGEKISYANIVGDPSGPSFIRAHTKEVSLSWEACHAAVNSWGLKQEFIMGPLASNDSPQIQRTHFRHNQHTLITTNSREHVGGAAIKAPRDNQQTRIDPTNPSGAQEDLDAHQGARQHEATPRVHPRHQAPPPNHSGKMKCNDPRGIVVDDIHACMNDSTNQQPPSPPRHCCVQLMVHARQMFDVMP
ncbi:uncharacterized protein A4U43_C01F34980 [Asparagus officinalis]|uniref:Uncharacterized protein n=1 Tax=Asparagus officinalis TaxID=4686 RepID=A0A5P1FXN2_ASPOF|nr:uncharacterized protein A4U43_C01F34980 [Asparagus officinalis]